MFHFFVSGNLSSPLFSPNKTFGENGTPRSRQQSTSLFSPGKTWSSTEGELFIWTIFVKVSCSVFLQVDTIVTTFYQQPFLCLFACISDIKSPRRSHNTPRKTKEVIFVFNYRWYQSFYPVHFLRIYCWWSICKRETVYLAKTYNNRSLKSWPQTVETNIRQLVYILHKNYVIH